MRTHCLHQSDVVVDVDADANRGSAAEARSASAHEMGQPVALALDAAGDHVQATRAWARVLSREERRMDAGARADLAKIHLGREASLSTRPARSWSTNASGSSTTAC
jgi:hypothetical protein